MLTAEQRRARDELRRQLKVLEDPIREARKIKQAKARREREKRIGKPAQGQRQPRVREPAYLQFLRRQPCEARHLGGCSGPSDAAHLRFSDFKAGRVNPGKGRKPDDKWALPLCRHHHTAQHAHGDERAWWSDVVQRDPTELCKQRYAEFSSLLSMRGAR